MPYIFSLSRTWLWADLLSLLLLVGASRFWDPSPARPHMLQNIQFIIPPPVLIFFTFLISDYLRLLINKYFCDCCDNRNVSTRIDSFWGDMVRSTTNTGRPSFATLCAVLLPPCVLSCRHLLCCPVATLCAVLSPPCVLSCRHLLCCPVATLCAVLSPPCVLSCCHLVCCPVATLCAVLLPPCVLSCCHLVCCPVATLCAVLLPPCVLSCCHLVCCPVATLCAVLLPPCVLSCCHLVCCPVASLCAVLLPLLSLHHSSADSERVFSMVKNTDIDCRSDLGQEPAQLNTGDVSVLLTGKMS